MASIGQSSLPIENLFPALTVENQEIDAFILTFLWESIEGAVRPEASITAQTQGKHGFWPSHSISRFVTIEKGYSPYL